VSKEVVPVHKEAERVCCSSDNMTLSKPLVCLVDRCVKYLVSLVRAKII
jgi:hypothetical protein